MADQRESFPVLEDGTGAGAALSKMLEGDSPSTKNGSIGFSFKSSAGNVILPTLTTDGRIPVSDDAAGTLLKNATVVAGNGTEVTILEITLAASKTYVSIQGRVTCFAESVYRLIFSNNAVETELDYALVGPGQFTAEIGLPKLEITSGGTGVQKLIIKGINSFNKVSDFRASLHAVEVA
jgi:hypothetical protein